MAMTTKAGLAGTMTSNGCGRPPRAITRATRAGGKDRGCMRVSGRACGTVAWAAVAGQVRVPRGPFPIGGAGPRGYTRDMPHAPIRILGIAPGLRRTGWGLIESDGNRLIHVACGSVE